MADGDPKVRWGRILLITLIGLAFTVAPFLLADRFHAGYGETRALVSSTLTNIGTTILLVAIVFFLERALLQRVSETAANTTARVVDERTTGLTTANEKLATQLADLRAQFEQAIVSNSADQSAPLRNVATDVSFDSVAEALEAANDVGALQGGVAVVPLKTPSDAPELVSFDWRLHQVRDPDGTRTDGYAPAISVNYLPTRHPDGGPGTPVVEVFWEPNEPPLDLLIRLRDEMTRHGFGHEAKAVDPDLLEHLGLALKDAVAGRKAAEGAWVDGPMYEWLADGWAVTSRGLMSRDHESIPARDLSARTFERPVPDGVSKAFWDFAVQRARGAEGDGRGGHGAVWYAGSPDNSPFTTKTSPRNRLGGAARSPTR